MNHLRCDQTQAWSALSEYHALHGEGMDLRHVATNDDGHQQQQAGIEAPEVFADLSRVQWDDQTLALLLKMAEECGLPAQRDALLRGDLVNLTEGRAALHTALRAPERATPHSKQVHDALDHMLVFADAVRGNQGHVCPPGITDIVHIGIGGSDLGPRMAIAALEPFTHPALSIHFVSNIDGQELASVLRKVQVASTLFIVASKTFTTQETMANAHTAKQWFLDNGGQDVSRHFVATTTNVQAATAFGITRTFGFWDWVGGRFSMWSTVGLPIAIAVGSRFFKEMLAGAHAMDRHFASVPLSHNLPVVLGLLDVWYRNFKRYTSRCLAPYHHGLRSLPAYIQQLTMESNGKSVDQQGVALSYATSDVIWGEAGTTGQHAFFQMLHQGSEVIPVEFLLVKRPRHRDHVSLTPTVRAMLTQQHQILLANGVAQAEALMWGKSFTQSMNEHAPTASPTIAPEVIARHRTFPGNRPSLTLVLNELNPRSLGALVALYEHRTFVSSAIWGINAFDQWGVELGKALCNELLPSMVSGNTDGIEATSAAMLARLR
ncbi:MAG: glucose-6-phosphate isomerase [Aquabacterium sp.]|uniref:glucose-6-phosphate isomerase n=1 Tax=Aquabacterium sp. TaxID=1872578 RepID=UPI001222E295|nr:glucose-6-phosphate isomerase [Aquabacterium sp.]TAK90834.1 MAG: glucose-6-phosphate isomerase [Aquabacterium sp.]